VSEEGATPAVPGEIHERIVSRGEPLEQVEDEPINAARRSFNPTETNEPQR
jgi:hypothetical protein